MTYQVIVNGQVVKEYDDKRTAYIYCHMKGYIYCGKGWYWLIGAKIVEALK